MASIAANFEHELAIAAVDLNRPESESTPVQRAEKSGGSACGYLFKDRRYVRYDIAEKTAAAPLDIHPAWPLPPSFQSDLNAALNWGNGYVYFFKGTYFVAYNIATNAVTIPRPIAAFAPRLPEMFHRDIDAAVFWDPGYLEFFKGEYYTWHNLLKHESAPEPRWIRDDWKALPEYFHRDIESVINWGNGFAYFFKGTKCAIYDIAKNQADGPFDISAKMPELHADFQSNVRAAVNWTYPTNLEALMTAAGLPVSPVGNWLTRQGPGPFHPIGVMIHHTALHAPHSLASMTIGNGTTPPPLANLHVGKTGLISIISGRQAHHAYLGPRKVLDEVSRNIAPVGTAAARKLWLTPNSRKDFLDGNSYFYGIECENLGNGKDGWPPAQLDTMVRASVALCRLHGWNGNRVIGHKEWLPGKTDPNFSDPNFDMPDFRALVWKAL